MAGNERDRKFMEFAIEEMLETRKDHTDKADPLVGAVLINRHGEEVARAHRGMFGPGDHSEFSILEKASAERDIRGDTIFVTLEPCVRRNRPKKPCAHRIVESGIARAVIGIYDPNPVIKGRGVQYLRKHGVKVEFFDDDLADEIRLYNRAFTESMINQKEKAEASMSNTRRIETATRDESKPIWQATVSDLSTDAIRSYLRYKGLSYNVPSSQLWQYFYKCGFLEKRKNRLVPTLGGLVLFGTKPDMFPDLKEHSITAEHFAGPPEEGISLERIAAGKGRTLIAGPLYKMVKDTERFYIKHVAKVPRLEGIKRIERGPEYPIKVVREVIVNAVVHRDYSRPAHISFRMFRDRIIVSSPGHLMYPNTLERVQAFDVTPVRRNITIADAARDMKLMEKEGYGIPNMPHRLRDYGLRSPHFDEKHGHFIVTLYGREKSSPTLSIRAELATQLSTRQFEVLDLIWERGKITSKEVRNKFQISRETANQDFIKLLDMNLIIRKGSGRATYYVFGKL